MLNLKQKLIVWTGLALIVVMGIYPPWTESFHYGDIRVGPRSGDYSWVFLRPGVPVWARNLAKARVAPDKPSPLEISLYWGFSIDLSRLLVQWAMVCFVVGGLVWTLKGPAII